jgi:hypothetical protein
MEGTDRHVFITGKAGTGKSTLLEYFCRTTKKQVAVLAPTGVAALNVDGQTVHSFCRFKPDITLDKVKKVRGEGGDLYSELDAVIIDEISMVRADLLDCVEKFLRLNGKHPKAWFGGTQMIFIGDLYQLPPVVTSRERDIFAGRYESPYFFPPGPSMSRPSTWSSSSSRRSTARQRKPSYIFLMPSGTTRRRRRTSSG